MTVVLDNDRETTTDGLDRFGFDEVEAGVHTVAIVPPKGVTCPYTEQSSGSMAEAATFVSSECNFVGGGGGAIQPWAEV